MCSGFHLFSKKHDNLNRFLRKLWITGKVLPSLGGRALQVEDAMVFSD